LAILFFSCGFVLVVLIWLQAKRNGMKMQTIDTQNPYELGDIQNRLKEKAKEYGFDEYTWMEAWQNAEATAQETNNFEDDIKEGYTWIEIFERVAFDSLEGLR
jgi:hypothetical protein